MASSYYRSVPFDSLPDDLLLEIVSYFGAQEDIPKRFRVAHALSRVNKRLRDFALPILLRSINVSGVIEFKSLLAYFSSRGQPYARYVRYVIELMQRRCLI